MARDLEFELRLLKQKREEAARRGDNFAIPSLDAQIHQIENQLNELQNVDEGLEAPGRIADESRTAANVNAGTRAPSFDSGQPEGRLGRAVNGVKEKTDALKKQYLDKLKTEVIKKAVQAAARAVWSAIAAYLGPAALPIVIGILVIIFVIFIAIRTGYISSPGVKPWGGGVQMPPNPVADKIWLKELLTKAGDVKINDDDRVKLVRDFDQKIENGLAELDKPEYAGYAQKANLKADLQTLKIKIDQLVQPCSSTSNNESDCASKIEEIRKFVKEMIKKYLSAEIKHYDGPGPRRLPVDVDKTPIATPENSGNDFLHYGTRWCNKNSNPPCLARKTGHYTWFFSNQGRGDAGDIKIGAGKPVYPVFTGTFKKGGEFNTLVSKDGRYIVGYAHINPAYADNSEITDLSKPLGTTNSAGHLHIEIKVDGKPINLPGEVLYSPDCKLRQRSGSDYGENGLGLGCATGAKESVNTIYWEKIIVPMFGS